MHRDREHASAGGVVAAVLANLLIGVLAIVPAFCAHWLVVEYPLVDCMGGLGCDKEAEDHVAGALAGAAVGGVVVLGALLVVDVAVPRQEGWPLRRWLGSAALVPVPFLLALAVGWI
ncbi:hypothetical protein GCM10023347_42160 [Streptomyces chumphonensis]|uniref:Uncharacterized protein n=1 Tax=Streptomyces chumphonensis TaxID=1214925 RepID=A0A927EX50_9ACTN|nr:hypothetical protein [Streptomyces chumphonensis]MBD3930274.1 hypothetical protein [Streptomyces chumphonensis]